MAHLQAYLGRAAAIRARLAPDATSLVQIRAYDRTAPSFSWLWLCESRELFDSKREKQEWAVPVTISATRDSTPLAIEAELATLEARVMALPEAEQAVQLRLPSSSTPILADVWLARLSGPAATSWPTTIVARGLNALTSEMRYRVGGPLIDGLMAELGMSGASLNGMLSGSDPVPASPKASAPELPSSANGDATGLNGAPN